MKQQETSLGRRVMKSLRRLMADTRGATAIEYGLIAALIGMVLILGLTNFYDALNNTFTYVTETTNNATSS